MKNDTIDLQEEPISVGSYLITGCCKESTNLEPQHFDQYFNKGFVECAHCHTKLNLWNIVVDHISKTRPFFAYSAIGAESIIFNVVLKKSENLFINFRDYGLPEKARILFLNFTGQGGGVSPFVLNINPRQIIYPHAVTLYPKEIPGVEPKDTVVCVYLTWISEEESENWKYLVDAFEFYAQRQYTSMIIPAHISFESRIQKVLGQLLLETSSKDQVEDCLGRSFGNSFNVILPAVLQPRGIPYLNEEIRGQLKRLRRLRNKLSHEGSTEETVDDAGATRLIAAAVFGFYYADFVEKCLETSR